MYWISWVLTWTNHKGSAKGRTVRKRIGALENVRWFGVSFSTASEDSRAKVTDKRFDYFNCELLYAELYFASCQWHFAPHVMTTGLLVGLVQNSCLFWVFFLSRFLEWCFVVQKSFVTCKSLLLFRTMTQNIRRPRAAIFSISLSQNYCAGAYSLLSIGFCPVYWIKSRSTGIWPRIFLAICIEHLSDSCGLIWLLISSQLCIFLSRRPNFICVLSLTIYKHYRLTGNFPNISWFLERNSYNIFPELSLALRLWLGIFPLLLISLIKYFAFNFLWTLSRNISYGF